MESGDLYLYRYLNLLLLSYIYNCSSTSSGNGWDNEYRIDIQKHLTIYIYIYYIYIYRSIERETFDNFFTAMKSQILAITKVTYHQTYITLLVRFLILQSTTYLFLLVDVDLQRHTSPFALCTQNAERRQNIYQGIIHQRHFAFNLYLVHKPKR